MILYNIPACYDFLDVHQRYQRTPKTDASAIPHIFVKSHNYQDPLGHLVNTNTECKWLAGWRKRKMQAKTAKVWRGSMEVTELTRHMLCYMRILLTYQHIGIRSATNMQLVQRYTVHVCMMSRLHPVIKQTRWKCIITTITRQIHPWPWLSQECSSKGHVLTVYTDTGLAVLGNTTLSSTFHNLHPIQYCTEFSDSLIGIGVSVETGVLNHIHTLYSSYFPLHHLAWSSTWAKQASSHVFSDSEMS